VKGLHQVINIGSQELYDEYDPLEEGLDHLCFSRTVTSLSILLTKIPQDQKHYGYQEPIDESLVDEN
jgi:hypothetical protein